MPSNSVPSTLSTWGAKLSVAGLALALAIPAAHATLLSYESFSGYTDSTTLPSQTPSPTVTGYTGNWVVGLNTFGTQSILSYTTGLSYSGLSTTGGRAGVPTNTSGGEIAAGNSGRVARQMDSSLSVTSSTDKTLYLGFLFQDGKETGATTYQTLALYDGINNANLDASRNFDIGLTTNGGQTGLAYDFGVKTGTGETYSSTGVASDTNVHLLVVKFTLSSTANDTVQVWVDPTSETSTSVSASAASLAWDTLTLSDYDGNSANWDEIRWGTTFADVTPTAIPEPSTYAAVLGALALGFVGLRRRRKTAA